MTFAQIFAPIYSLDKLMLPKVRASLKLTDSKEKHVVYDGHRLRFFFYLKGIVHPKMKILSSFTHSQVVPNLYECLCSAEHRGRYSEECRKQSSSGAPLISIVFFFLLWKSMVPQNSLITNFLQNIFL